MTLSSLHKTVGRSQTPDLGRAVMNHDASASGTELHDMSGVNNLQSPDSSSITAGFMEGADNPSRPQSLLSTNRALLIPTEQIPSPRLGRSIILYYLLYIIPLLVIIAIFTLNTFRIY